MQATLADVNGLFKPHEGALWTFYDSSLQKLLPKQGAQYVAVPQGTMSLTPAFVSFFNRAAAFSDGALCGQFSRSALELHAQAAAQRRHPESEYRAAHRRPDADL